ncbi:MAG: EAL domain-containing protein [Aliarcobacter sp.]|nr:EAL domain-containing protein [Aliarcobacter sp.]
MALTKLISQIDDSINCDVTLQEVLDFMIKNRTKHTVLLKDKKPVGIITERDILFLYAKHENLNLKAFDFANKRLITSKQSRKIDYVLGLMLNHNVRRVLVVDKEDNYLGCIIQEKIIFQFEQDLFKTNIKAKELIKNNSKAVHVQKEVNIQNVIDLMTQKNIGSVLIFDKNEPIGILTESDVINLAQKHIDSNLNIQEFMHQNLICFDEEELLFDVVTKMKENEIRRAVIFNKKEKEYFVITSKDILNNIKGNYNLFLESKLKDVKNTFNSLNEAVIELFDNDDEQIIYWFNKKSSDLFDIEIDKNITTIIPHSKWEDIYKKIKTNTFNQNEIFEIKNNQFQLTVLNTVLLENSIIKLLFTNITELANKNKEIESKFKFLYDEAPYPYQSLNDRGVVCNVNKKWLEITGYEKDEVIGQKFFHFSDETFERLKEIFKVFLVEKHVENEHIKIKKKNNEVFLASFTGNISNINDEIRTHCIFKDITQEEIIEKKLKLSDIVFENTTEGIIITDETGKIISINSAFTNITGYTFDEIIYQNPRILKSGKHDKEFYSKLWHELEKKGSWKGEIWNRKKSGEIYPEWLNLSVAKDSNGKVLNYVALFSDITKIKNSTAKIDYLAHHDPLTNLPNRLLLNARLNKSIEKCNELSQRLAIFFIDIDNFKIINDSYGHSIGDKIINLVAQRLQKNVRKNDTISRIGGDEFIIVIEDILERKDIEKIAKKILNDFLEPIKLEEYLFDTTISMGISIFPNNGLNGEDLIKHADTAMYSAKNAGRNQYQFYKDEMTSEIFEKIVMKQEISDAIKNNEFEVYYQPQIDIKTNKIIGAEALLRWNHKSLGVITPDEFIPHAEESRLIIPLGDFVLKTACSFMKKLHEMNLLEDGKIAVNISSIQFKHSDIYKTVLDNLKITNLDANYLELELTESFIMENIEESIMILKNLKEIGVQLSIDDFGTGYSSLSYLKQFPIDKLKIDKSFIAEIPHSLKDIAIAKTIIALAKGLGMKVIAEGVEKINQKEFLELENCDEIQGWFYAKALKEEDFIEFVRNFK